MRQRLSFIVPAALCISLAAAAEPAPLDALRARFPQGIPWQVDIIDGNGRPGGTLVLRITKEKGESCLGDMDDGVRVEFARKEGLPPALSVESYGVAKVSGDKIKIDLTGGMCDAYLILEGTFDADGSSSGNIRSFGMRGGKDLATYRAHIK